MNVYLYFRTESSELRARSEAIASDLNASKRKALDLSKKNAKLREKIKELTQPSSDAQVTQRPKSAYATPTGVRTYQKFVGGGFNMSRSSSSGSPGSP